MWKTVLLIQNRTAKNYVNTLFPKVFEREREGKLFSKKFSLAYS